MVACTYLCVCGLFIGLKTLLGDLISSVVKTVPGASSMIDKGMDKEVEKSLKDMLVDGNEATRDIPNFVSLPEKSTPRKLVLQWLKVLTLSIASKI